MNHYQTLASMLEKLADAMTLQVFLTLAHHKMSISELCTKHSCSEEEVSKIIHNLEELSLIDCHNNHYEVVENRQTDLLHHFIEDFYDELCPDASLVDIHSLKPQNESQEIIQDVHEYLLEHLSERISIEELSKEFLMSPTTLKTTFKKVYGTSIAAHIYEHRMEEAEKLLRDTNMSINDIALAVGYSSASKFTEAFKKNKDMLPSDYRKAHK